MKTKPSSDDELSFEVRRKDLLGRIGLLRTRHGTVETPLLLPVVNPNTQLIPTRELRDVFGFDAVITNSYIVWRRYRSEPAVPRIHDLLGFDGVIVTDSGAYQILRYGDVEVTPEEAIRFQQALGSDIAVILDIPTGQEPSEARAKWTVEETIRRADEALKLVSGDEVLWVGPVQGGMYPKLVSYSAREMAKRKFSIYALGSPTPVMQQYRFDILVDMVMAAKVELPPDRPLHLFGAGHPMMFAMSVALGCDIFDSASYALFARKGRYMTAQGTSKLDGLEYFPCDCPVCHKRTPEQVRKLLPVERERFLASHNLHSCHAELQTVKQAIVDGRLWELVEARSKSHPAMQRAFQRMLAYAGILERETPISKGKGPFLVSEGSLRRPEALRHAARLLERYQPPPKAKLLLLLPDSSMKPFRDGNLPTQLVEEFANKSAVHICSYGLSYGIVPQEIEDVYPLSQTENALLPTPANVANTRRRIVAYIKSANYKRALIVATEPWQLSIAKTIRKNAGRKIRIEILETEDSDQMLSAIRMRLKERRRSKR